MTAHPGGRSPSAIIDFGRRLEDTRSFASHPACDELLQAPRFFLLQRAAAPEACCANHGSIELQAYAKRRIKELGESGKGKVRMNKAGCLDRCEEGPVLVVYPEAVWYTYVDRSDIDEIIDRHVLNGEIVERLRI
jgi:(2Fe-2S) ferredoxin